MKENSFIHLTLLTLIILTVVNIFLLNIKVFSPSSMIQISDVSNIATPQVQQTKTTPQDNLSCPKSCLDKIFQATTAGQLYIGSTETKIEEKQLQTSLREYFIPLGTGNTDKSSWVNVTATETLINPALYGNIKEAYFIASLKNPTQNGQVEAQLYNATDKHPVWGSHVIMNSLESQTIISEQIQLDNAAKLYLVQIKSSLSFPVYLESAKIRILAEN